MKKRNKKENLKKKEQITNKHTNKKEQINTFAYFLV